MLYLTNVILLLAIQRREIRKKSGTDGHLPIGRKSR